jgi:hypothetical protein
MEEGPEQGRRGRMRMALAARCGQRLLLYNCGGGSAYSGTLRFRGRCWTCRARNQKRLKLEANVVRSLTRQLDERTSFSAGACPVHV